MSKIAELWAQEIGYGRKTIEEVPVKLLEEVKALLLANKEGQSR